MKHSVEFRRTFPITELRADDTSEGRKISGYASVFDSYSEPISGLFREIVRPGAFRKTLGEGDQILLWSHDTGKPMARKSAGTLNLREDDRGLWFEAQMNGTSWADDAFKAIESRDVTQMSFGFSVIKDRWTFDRESELDQRELLEVALYEVSPVAFPAYPATDVQARSIYESAKAQRGAVTPAATGADSVIGDTTSEPDAQAAHHSEAGRHRVLLAKRKLELLALP